MKIYFFFITFSFFSIPVCPSDSPTSKERRDRIGSLIRQRSEAFQRDAITPRTPTANASSSLIKPQRRALTPRLLANSQPSTDSIKHKSAEFLRNALTPTSLARSIDSTDDDITSAKELNDEVSAALEKKDLPQTNTVAASSGACLNIPLLNLLPTKSKELLEKAYRALGLLELTQEKDPHNKEVIHEITRSLEYIKRLDPPTNPDGIPESARQGSSERKRRWEKLHEATGTPRHPSPLTKESPKEKTTNLRSLSDPIITFEPTGPTGKRKKKSPKHKAHCPPPTTPGFSLPLEKLHQRHTQFSPDNLQTTFDTHAPDFIDTISRLIDNLKHMLSPLNSPGNVSPRFFSRQSPTNICEQEKIHQEILSSLLPVFTPLTEHYFSTPTEHEQEKTKLVIHKAYKIFTRIQTKGIHTVLSHAMNTAIDRCAVIVQDIKTPRSRKPDALELHQLSIRFTENMRLIQTKEKTIVPGNLPAKWEHSTEISEELLIDTAGKLLTGLTRSDDLLRLHMTVSRNDYLMKHPEIKSLMEAAAIEITNKTLKERKLASPRHHKPFGRPQNMNLQPHNPTEFATSPKGERHSEFFLHDADQLTASGDKALEVLLEHKGKKHRHRFLSLSKKKKSPTTMSSASSSTSPSARSEKLSCHNAPGILHKDPQKTREQIFDDYMSALSAYAAHYKKESPATSTYIRIQTAHIIEQLAQLFAPIDLCAPTTMFEPKYDQILNTSRDITRDPLMPELIINDIANKHAAAEELLKSNPSTEQLDTLCRQLHIHIKVLAHMHASSRIDQHQKIIIHAYAKQACRLSDKMPLSQCQTISQAQLLNERRQINAQPTDLQPLFNALNERAIQRNKILNSPETAKNEAFCTQLIEDQCKILRNLLCLHQANEGNPFRQYWISKAADNIITSITKKLMTGKPNENFSTLCRSWQEQSIDTETMLKLIDEGEHTVATGCEMLSILIDLYAQNSLPPAFLSHITDPLHTILDTLFVVLAVKLETLSKEQLQLIHTSKAVAYKAQYEYPVVYHLTRAKGLNKTNKNEAKRAYLAAAKHILNTPTAAFAYDPMTKDRICSRLLFLYERNVYFLEKELVLLNRFARCVNFDLPEDLRVHIPSPSMDAELKKESDTFRAFAQRLAAQGALAKKHPEASSSSATASSSQQK